MADWFPMPADLLDDERVRGLSAAAFRAYVELRIVACRAESGGVVLVPDARHKHRRGLALHPPLVCPATGVGVPSIPHWRAIHSLHQTGLLVPFNGGYRLHDFAEWEAREARIRADRDRSRRARTTSSDGVRDMPSVDKQRRRTRTRTRGKAVERERSDLSLLRSVEHPATADTTPRDDPKPDRRQGDMRRIQLAPELQQPDDDGIRPYVRQAIKAHRNIRDDRYLLDSIGDTAALTEQEQAAVNNALHGNATQTQ